MHSIPYRTKMRLKAGFKVALIVLAVLVVLDVLAIVFLGRYIVYGKDGAYVDPDRSTGKNVDPSQYLQTPEETSPEVEVIYGDPQQIEEGVELLSGYYITTSMLQDPAAVMTALRELDDPCTVMIDLKSGSGSFYYSTGIVGAVTADTIDVRDVDNIIAYLKMNGFHMIARIKAFTDTNFALSNFACGIHETATTLWRDSHNHYWMNPDYEIVIDYLVQIINELSGKGFEEIVLDDFYFPDSTKILYTAEKTRPELINDTAKRLEDYFLQTSVRISFGNPQPDFKVESTTSRIYLSDVDGAGVSDAVLSYAGSEEDAAGLLVFLTDSRDTRFRGYSILQSLPVD